jgi:uncharacterized protein
MPAMSQSTLPAFKQGLAGLTAILDKLANHCAAKGIDPVVFLNARLYPDMFATTRQIQIACDFAKGAVARLAGVENPAYEDKEATIDELKARIAKTLAFIESVPASALDGSETKTITMKIRGTEHSWPGETYLVNVAIPNFYFHLTTAYAILRHNGLDIGKNDFLARA